MSEARLRIFAGPNGCGKSKLFDSFSKKYNSGIFLNADLIEKELSTKGFIDLSEFNLNLTQNDLDDFLKTERAISLIKKSNDDNHKIDFSLKENIIVSSEQFNLIAKIEEKHLSLKVEPTELPNWFIEYVLKYYV